MRMVAAVNILNDATFELDNCFLELLMKENSMSYENNFFRNHSKNESYLSKFIKDLTIPFEYKIKGFQIQKQKAESLSDDFQIAIDSYCNSNK